MSNLEQYLLSVVDDIVSEKRHADKAPALALRTEIVATATAEITHTLTELAKRGNLKECHNINQVPMYELNDNG